MFLALAVACGPTAPDGDADDADGDGKADVLGPDQDQDGLSDAREGRGAGVDTDGDKIPDYLDLDSDADGIKDSHELSEDPDGDEIGAWRDDDSDGDCIPDRLEAGDADPLTAPSSLDDDGWSDALDTDADGDGVPDADEDEDCDGVKDAGETDRRAPDSDGDGVTDLVEQVATTDPLNPNDHPRARGNFVFLVPYAAPPAPARDTLDFATKITKADVVFLMDTTGSMGQELAKLKSSVQAIATTLAVDIPQVALGAAGYEDFPDAKSCYGMKSAADRPFYLVHRVASVGGSGLTSVKNALGGMVTRDGRDAPESGWQAIHELMTGQGITHNGVSVPAFNAASFLAPAGETVGTIGGAGFRSGALPIVVWVTDEASHNSEQYPGWAYGAPGYTFDNQSCGAVTGAATRAQAIAEAKAVGAKVLPVLSYGGYYNAQAHADMTKIVVETGSKVPPTAWGTVGRTCAIGKCCTGQGGAAEEPDATGMCPLIFRIAADGSGLDTSITKAIDVLTKHAVLDIGAAAEDDAADSVDAVSAFVDSVRANVTAGGTCATGIAISGEVFQNVLPGTVVCFDVVPKQNSTVPATDQPQVYRARVSVVGDGVTKLDTREVLFLVPPAFTRIHIE